jgi:hypothetical protein
MKLPRRRFLHLAAGAAALPTLSRIAWAQTYPTRTLTLTSPRAYRQRYHTSHGRSVTDFTMVRRLA